MRESETNPARRVLDEQARVSNVSAHHRHAPVPGLIHDGALGLPRLRCTGCETGAKTVAAKPYGIDSDRRGSFLHDPSHIAVGQSVAELAAFGDAAEDRAVDDARNSDPCVERAHWAGGRVAAEPSLPAAEQAAFLEEITATVERLIVFNGHAAQRVKAGTLKSRVQAVVLSLVASLLRLKTELDPKEKQRGGQQHHVPVMLVLAVNGLREALDWKRVVAVRVVVACAKAAGYPIAEETLRTYLKPNRLPGVLGNYVDAMADAISESRK